MKEPFSVNKSLTLYYIIIFKYKYMLIMNESVSIFTHMCVVMTLFRGKDSFIYVCHHVF